MLGVFYMKLEELGQGDKSLLLVLYTASSLSVFCAKDEAVRAHCHGRWENSKIIGGFVVMFTMTKNNKFTFNM